MSDETPAELSKRVRQVADVTILMDPRLRAHEPSRRALFPPPCPGLEEFDSRVGWFGSLVLTSMTLPVGSQDEAESARK